MSELKISVIIPTYNQGHFIEETIQSILQQNYDNTEIIIIDGKSTDNTLEVIKNYESKINYWISEKDSGQSEAINKGFRIASGDIITWLNSDDCFEPDALVRIEKEFTTDADLSIVHGKAILYGDKISSRIIGLQQDIPLHEYLAYMRFPQPSSFFRSSVAKLTGGVNDNLHYAMDYELFSKAILSGAKIKRIDNILSRYRIHTNSKSNNDLLFLKEWSDVLCSIFNSLENGGEFVQKLKEAGLTEGMAIKPFETKLVFTTKQLQDIFLLHLDLCYHTYYRHFEYEKCVSLSNYIKENYPAFYTEKKYRKYNLRLKLIPMFVFSLMRK